MKESLENDALTVEEIIKKEDDLADCLGYKYAPVYGVATPDIGTRTIFTYDCSDGKKWSQGEVKIKDNLL